MKMVNDEGTVNKDRIAKHEELVDKACIGKDEKFAADITDVRKPVVEIDGAIDEVMLKDIRDLGSWKADIVSQRYVQK